MDTVTTIAVIAIGCGALFVVGSVVFGYTTVKIAIETNQSKYRPGEIIHGHVTLTAKRTVSLQNLTASLVASDANKRDAGPAVMDAHRENQLLADTLNLSPGESHRWSTAFAVPDARTPDAVSVDLGTAAPGLEKRLTPMLKLADAKYARRVRWYLRVDATAAGIPVDRSVLLDVRRQA